MSSERRHAELSIDNPTLMQAKEALNACMKIAVAQAIEKGSMEGSATLKISFKIEACADKDTGQQFYQPEIDFKAGYSIPMKDSIDGKIIDACRMIARRDGKLCLIGNQISMAELMDEEE